MWLNGPELEIGWRHVKLLHDSCNKLRQNLITRLADGLGKSATKTNLDILPMLCFRSVPDVRVRVECGL